MKLSNVEIRPGYVKQVLDNNGTIKAIAEGLFNETDLDLLPPIRVFFTTGKGAFSAPQVNDPIWVIYDRTNPQDLRWLRQPDTKNRVGHITASGNKNTEVVMSRDQGLDKAEIYFADDKGMVIQNKKASVVIDKDQNVTLSNSEDNRTIDINKDGISLGTKGGSKYSAVVGEPLLTVLLDIDNLFSTIQKVASANPYTTQIATAIQAMLPKYEQDIQSVLSDHVNLD